MSLDRTRVGQQPYRLYVFSVPVLLRGWIVERDEQGLPILKYFRNSRTLNSLAMSRMNLLLQHVLLLCDRRGMVPDCRRDYRADIKPTRSSFNIIYILDHRHRLTP